LAQEISQVMNPQIKFSLNKKLDCQMLFEFLGAGIKAGSDFSAAIVEYHPGLKGKSLKREVTGYVDCYYTDNRKKIFDSKNIIQKSWQEVESDFFSLVPKYFPDVAWPEGKYICYVAIDPIGPRFLSNCTWQTPYLWPDQAKGQIVHELLHFIFYAQIKLLPQNQMLNQEQRWHLSEIFNDVIQKENGFVKIQGYVPKISYPDHKKVHPKYLKIWRSSPRAKDFIKNAAKEIIKDF
jgi:hypothetical protein